MHACDSGILGVCVVVSVAAVCKFGSGRVGISDGVGVRGVKCSIEA